MAYNAGGRRPFERASRSSHHHIINDAEVTKLISSSWIPAAQEPSEADWHLSQPTTSAAAAVEHIITVDGSFAETVIQPKYPSSAVGFMQFGALSFRRADLDVLDDSPHPDPEDMQRLRNLERLKLVYPMRGVRLKDCDSLTDSVRRTIYEFFLTAKLEGVSLAETLAWLVFDLYRPAAERRSKWHLASDPTDPERAGLDLSHASMTADFTFHSPAGGNSRIYLTDVLRLHEKIDEETGASGIMGHLLGAVEQLLVLHVMRLIHKQQPVALGKCLFLRDGPLAFFGQTSNLHAPFRAALAWLRRTSPVYLVGVEKSGAFVEHAQQIASRIPRGSALILTDSYIYKYIIPKDISSAEIYGRNTYYGRKVIYVSSSGGVHVASVPTSDANPEPAASDLLGFDVALACMDQLRCDMYDSALFPVALANKLVSLSAHPSQRILQRFATSTVGTGG